MTGQRAAPEGCIIPGCTEPVDAFALCNSDLFALIGQCLGKKRLPEYTRRGLRIARAGSELVKYNCPICGQWHMGTVLPDQAARSARTAELLTALRNSGQGWRITWLAGQIEGLDRTQWKAQHAARKAAERVEAARRGPMGDPS
jgi:hypothetical protein